MKFDFEEPTLLALAFAVPVVIAILRYTLVDSPRLQLALSTVTRCLILLLLAGALASALWVTKTKALSVVVLTDLSDSVTDSASSQATNFWNSVRTNINGKGRAGLVSFSDAEHTVVPLGANPGCPDVLQNPTN